MFERIIKWLIHRFVPATGTEWIYVYMAAAAAGTAITVNAQVEANRRRQAILEQEMRDKKLQALDEETERVRALRYANDEMLSRSGGIDAWASPSLIAARSFNFKMYNEDASNINYNKMSAEAGIGARIAILQKNSRAAVQAGIFEIAGIVAGGMYQAGQLGKTAQVPTGGAGGLNEKMGVGILDTPGGTGALS